MTIETSSTPGGRRTRLSEVLPLKTPFLFQVFPVYACNLRCEFCVNGLPKSERGFISDVEMMDFSLYKKAIDSIRNFQNKLKMLRFAGIGEPLLHKNIAEMVAYAVERKVSERVDIVTNGLALNPELSYALIKAGLTTLRVSINGLSAEDYQKNCGTAVHFERMIENLRVFFKHRGNTRVYIKIIDYIVKTEEQNKRFIKLFEPLCDAIAIEHLTPTVEKIDIKKIAGDISLDVTQGGSPLIDAKVCPQPFYMLQMNPDGKVVPCCSMTYPGIFGNVNEEHIHQIWNSKELNAFRKIMLSGSPNAGVVCNKCQLYKYGLYPEDVLDQEAERLKLAYM